MNPARNPASLPSRSAAKLVSVKCSKNSREKLVRPRAARSRETIDSVEHGQFFTVTWTASAPGTDFAAPLSSGAPEEFTVLSRNGRP